MPNFYNPYGPYPYSPYGNNNNQPTTQINQYAFVNGVEGAKAYPVMPNQTMMLMDNDNPIIFMKTANSLGQTTLRYFKMIEINEHDLHVNNNPSVQYALQSDLNAINKRLDDLTKKMEKPVKTRQE